MDTLGPHLHCRVPLPLPVAQISLRAGRPEQTHMQAQASGTPRRPDSPHDNRYHQPARQPGR